MTEHRIATLAMKLFGLYIGFRGVEGTARSIEFLLSSSFEFSVFMATGFFTFLFFIALGVVIWARAERLASLAMPERDRSEDESEAVRTGSELTARTVLNLAFVVLGVYLLTSAVVSGTTAVALWIETLQPDGSATDELRRTFALQQGARRSAYTAAGSFIAGIVLLLGARGLSTFFRRSWWAGADETPSSENELTEVEVQEWPDDG